MTTADLERGKLYDVKITEGSRIRYLVLYAKEGEVVWFLSSRNEGGSPYLPTLISPLQATPGNHYIYEVRDVTPVWEVPPFSLHAAGIVDVSALRDGTIFTTRSLYEDRVVLMKAGGRLWKILGERLSMASGYPTWTQVSEARVVRVEGLGSTVETIEI